MSARALAWAFRQRGLDPGAQLLLLWLSDQACDEGLVGLYKALSRRAVAGVLGCSTDTVDRRLKALEAAGLLAVQRRFDGATPLPSVYRLALPHDAATPSRADAATPSRADAATVAASAPIPPAAPMRPLTRVVNLREYSEAVVQVELNSETDEPSGGRRSSFSSGPPRSAASMIVEAVASPWLDPAKSLGLLQTAAEVERWLRAGADLETLIIPTIAAMMARPRTRPVTVWSYFTPAITQALSAAARAELPLPVISTHEESARVHTTPFSRDPGAQRAARQRGLTAALVCADQGLAEGADLHELDAVAIAYRPRARPPDV